jgi:hypothetical protein
MNRDTDQLPQVEMTPEPPKSGEYPFTEDLNPQFLEGENYGLQGPHPEKQKPRTAYDVKSAHSLLQGMEDTDLQEIPIMPSGSRLEQGATYIDLCSEHPAEFTATGNMQAGGDNWYVPKTEVPYWLWNRLIGVENPERLDEQ